MNVSGTTKDGAQANGTITFPEVSHEVEDEGEEYRVRLLCLRPIIHFLLTSYDLPSQFETEMASASSDATRALYEIVRKELAPSLLPTFHAFRATLIETHAKDLGHQNSPSGSGASTPASAPDPAKASTSAAPPPNAKKAGTVSTSSSDVRVSSQLAISQTDLWDLLTNPARIPMWSRAPAQVSDRVRFMQNKRALGCGRSRLQWLATGRRSIIGRGEAQYFYSASVDPCRL